MPLKKHTKTRNHETTKNPTRFSFSWFRGFVVSCLFGVCETRLAVLLAACTLAALAGSTALSAEERPAAAAGTFSLKIPDVPVSDQNGRRLNFYSDLVNGRTVVINFMFTTCTTI